MKTFSVKNYEKFQHYKDRSPPWIKLYNELLDDYEFGLLPDASKMHLVAIWLLASRSENKIPFDPAWVAKRINATEAVDLQLLADRKFIPLNQRVQGVDRVASKPRAKRLSSFCEYAGTKPPKIPKWLPSTRAERSSPSPGHGPNGMAFAAPRQTRSRAAICSMAS
jgi:hypothetical protein